jgi:SAM-dependent methyltransferase
MTARRQGIPEPLRARWNKTYAETPYRDLPWFSRTPYVWVKQAATERWFRPGGRVLDVGCGAGTNSLFLAGQGFRASGVDLAEGAIHAARRRAEKAGLSVDFRVGDALRLPYPRGEFDGLIDVGCFHTLPTSLRRAYSKELARVLRPGGRYALSWVAREFEKPFGPPHRPSLKETAATFEEEFLFLRTEFRASSTGRRDRDSISVYCALLERRMVRQPPVR